MFAGHCLAKLATGSVQSVKTLRPGYRLWGGYTVVCIVFVPLTTDVQMMRFHKNGPIVSLNTRVHEPISERWIDSKDAPTATQMTAHLDGYYSLLLDKGHTIQLNGITLSTIPHSSPQCSK